MKTRLGQDCNDRTEFATVEKALQNIPAKESGYIWILHRRCWRIAGNYIGGKAYNGVCSQIVPATAQDLTFLARNSL